MAAPHSLSSPEPLLRLYNDRGVGATLLHEQIRKQRAGRWHNASEVTGPGKWALAQGPP